MGKDGSGHSLGGSTQEKRSQVLINKEGPFYKELLTTIEHLQRQIDILNNKVKHLEAITCAR